MLNKKIKLTIDSDEVLLLLISIFYAGISSNIFFGFRVIDFLIIIAVLSKFRSKISIQLLFLLFLWAISIAISTYVGISHENIFIKSDVRFFIIFGLSMFLGYSLGVKSNINMESLFYKLVIFILLMYLIIPLLDFIRFYYIPRSFQKDEHANTIFGPSVILLNYVYLYLVITNRKQKYYFYATYFITALIIYKLRISRQDLAIMLLLLLWSLIYNIYDKIKVKHLIIGFIVVFTSSISMLIFNTERIKGILNPNNDTSFGYRTLSNNAFVKLFSESSQNIKMFGMGMGSTVDFHFNDWFGTITFTILDNGPLTILMKTGLFGLIILILILYYPIKKLNLHQKIILLFPVFVSMFLFSHIIYNLLYILSLFFIAFKLKSEENNTKKSNTLL